MGYKLTLLCPFYFALLYCQFAQFFFAASKHTATLSISADTYIFKDNLQPKFDEFVVLESNNLHIKQTWK
jgi:hypothetical protein